MITDHDIRQHLRAFRLPSKDLLIPDPKIVESVQLQGRNVFIVLNNPLLQGNAEKQHLFQQQVENCLKKLPGIADIKIVLTAETPSKTTAPVPFINSVIPPVAGIKKIIAVASGKGGVGKSTVTTNLAVALAGLGLKVGILDADIYGPSQPALLGIPYKKPQLQENKKFTPPEAFGVACMSMGFLVDISAPLIWRGPMVMGAIQQLLNDTNWGEKDILVVDLPPGTGDAQLTLVQKVPLNGAVIVSTPQDIALLDARKGLNMFRKVNIPILGMIENMSYFICPHCGEQSDIFSHGGAAHEAEVSKTEFLGHIPLDLTLRQTSDSGKPLIITQPDHPISQIFKSIAQKIWRQI